MQQGVAKMTHEKPHAVCIPYPAQGHITPMLNLAKLLHFKFNFHITFVNTEHNHRRLLHSQGPTSLEGLPSFHFETIADGLPSSDPNVTQDIPALSSYFSKNGHNHLKELLLRLGARSPKVKFIISDCAMTFSLDVAIEMGMPLVFLWTASACSFVGYAQYSRLLDEGIIPLKDASERNYLEKVIDGVPGMEGICLKVLPSFVRTTSKDDIFINIFIRRIQRLCNASAPIIFHTFEALEHDVLQAITSMCRSQVYPIGPLHLLYQEIDDKQNFVQSNLWQEDSDCLKWLDSKPPNSVLYINFGSVTVTNSHNFTEMAWGFANSDQNFLWVIRPDLVSGEYTLLPHEFQTKTKGKGFIANWCNQKTVLRHPSIAGFVTHCGWNSILESLSNGVPMICWPYFADQMTNCWFSCQKWGVGLQLDNVVKRGQVEQLVRELMLGEKGKEMKRRAMEWEVLAKEAAISPNGSSLHNLDKLIKQLSIDS